MQNAILILEGALVTREYTVEEVRPLLQPQLADKFLPQTVPAYAAHQTFARLNRKYPEYTYREAVLNPTNPTDRATAWDVGIIREFRNNPNKTVIMGQRKTEDGQSFYLAQPIQIKNKACLQCHSTPDIAPQSMLKLYGESNGFGWQFEEIVGIQIVSVPTSVEKQKAKDGVVTLLVSLSCVFGLIFIAINVMLRKLIVAPLSEISKITDGISLGNMDIDELPAVRSGEIGAIEKSINRLRRSLEKAMKLVDDKYEG